MRRRRSGGPLRGSSACLVCVPGSRLRRARTPWEGSHAAQGRSPGCCAGPQRPSGPSAFPGPSAPGYLRPFCLAQDREDPSLGPVFSSRVGKGPSARGGARVSPQWPGPRRLGPVPGGVRGAPGRLRARGGAWVSIPPPPPHRGAALGEGGRDGDQAKPVGTWPQAPPLLEAGRGGRWRAELTWGHSDAWPFHPACCHRGQPS